MSSVTVTLPPDTERKLREKADSAGLTLETYISTNRNTGHGPGIPAARIHSHFNCPPSGLR